MQFTMGKSNEGYKKLKDKKLNSASKPNITWTPPPPTSLDPTPCSHPLCVYTNNHMQARLVIQLLQLLAWLNDGARCAEPAQVCEVWFDAVDHLIWRTSFCQHP